MGAAKIYTWTRDRRGEVELTPEEERIELTAAKTIYDGMMMLPEYWGLTPLPGMARNFQEILKSGLTNGLKGYILIYGNEKDEHQVSNQGRLRT